MRSNNSLLYHAQQLISSKCNDTEHQVRHNLNCPLHPNHSSSELIFEPCINTFRGGAFTISHFFGWSQFPNNSVTGVGINNRNMPQLYTIGGNMLAIVSRIFQLIKTFNTLICYGSQWNGNLTVMRRSGSQQAGNGYLTVPGIYMEFESVPRFHVTFTVYLHFMVTQGWKFCHHFLNSHGHLTFDSAQLRKPLFTFARSSTLLFGFRRLFRLFIRFFPSFDFRAILRNMPEQMVRKSSLNQCLVGAFSKLTLCKLPKYTGKGGLTGHLVSFFPSTHPSQNRIGQNAITEVLGGRRVTHSLCYKCPPQRFPAGGWTTIPIFVRDFFFYSSHFQCRGNFLVKLSERSKLFFQNWKQMLLNSIPNRRYYIHPNPCDFSKLYCSFPKSNILLFP